MQRIREHMIALVRHVDFMALSNRRHHKQKLGTSSIVIRHLDILAPLIRSERRLHEI